MSKLQEDEARCYVCNRKQKKKDMLDLTGGVYRCKGHRWEKVLAASKADLESRGKSSIV